MCVCVCVCACVREFHILCGGMGDGAVPRLGEFLEKSRSKKIGPQISKSVNVGNTIRPPEHRTLPAIRCNSTAFQ